ncbi:MAG: NAD-dependent epimerase/dehydratase family protein [Planctomycetes bacterium]|nr:NAD-dependent epimerase/dehydratase family protein [Planctomycetota bacterium]
MSGLGYRDRRVLVTGARGFVGRHVVTRLVSEGARVTALIGASPVEPPPRGVAPIAADVTDDDALRRVLGDRPFDVVFHLAANVDASRDPRDPAAIVRANVVGTLGVLRAVEKSGCSAFVLASSAEVYGDGEAPFREDAHRRPGSPYAASKSTAEDLALAYQRSLGWPVIVARIFQPYGPGQSGRFIVPSLLQAIVDGRVLDMTAGEQARDFVYVDDVAEALMRIGARPELAGRTLNVGTGVATRLRDLVDVACAIVPSAPRPNLGALPYRAAEVMRQQADVTSLEAAVGWMPATPLDWGVRLTIESIRQEKDAERRRATGS